MDIKVLSKPKNFDFSIFSIGLFTLNEIDVTSVDDLITKVTQALGSEKLRRLDISAHGDANNIFLGETALSGMQVEKYNESVKVLGKLKPLFAENGFIVLNVCDVGKNSEFTSLIAKVTGVPVYANTGGIHANLGNKGRGGVEVKSYPNGYVERNIEYADSPPLTLEEAKKKYL